MENPVPQQDQFGTLLGCQFLKSLVADYGSMRAHELNVFLDPKGEGPLYLRVAESILRVIHEGRLPKGASLPGTRDLADRLGVTRNTITAALRELEAQGWLLVRPQSGFFVSQTPPIIEKHVAKAIRHHEPGFDLPRHLSPITDLGDIRMDFTEGMADARWAPTEAISRAYQRGLKLKGVQLLGTPDFKGLRRLRAALVEHLAQQRSCSFEADQILLLRSTSMAISLVSQALVGSGGGFVALEDPGNPAVKETIQQACSATLHPFPVDKDGIQVEALEGFLQQHRLAFLVLSPQCQHPTGVRLSESRREAILALAKAHRFPILELDAEHDFLPSPCRPLAASDTTGQVLYIGSLSRALAPGIGLAFLGVPAALANQLARARQRMDWQGDPLLEWVISELLHDGEYLRQLRRVRKMVAERRDAVIDALNHTLTDRIIFDPGHGAMALWLKGQGHLEDPERFELWIRACIIKGIKLRSGKYFSIAGQPLASTRLGFTAHTPAELQTAVALMK